MYEKLNIVGIKIVITKKLQDQNNILNAMKRQPIATYGLFLSPILAHFQKIPPTLQT